MNAVNPVIDRAAEAKIKRGHIAILLNTRGRPEMLLEVFTSLKATTACKDKVALWLYVDDDDRVTRQAIDQGKFPDLGFPVHWHIGPRTPDWGQTYTTLWNTLGRTSEVYMIANDDVRFETFGWDDIVRAKYAEYPDGVLLTCPYDPVAPDIATFPIVGWGWLNALGSVYAGYFHYWFDDKWADQLGRMVGRYANIHMWLSPIRSKGKTQRMRCLPFWARFFQLTLGERKELAKKLIAAMQLPDEKARAAALAAMEEAATELKKEEDTFSDIYATFQEERHTAMSPEERDQYSQLYFKQEAKAVGRLMAHAQAHMAQKNYAEAMTYLDATQLSDLRVRTIQLMKVDCLRALGRPAEADRLAREAFATWPQMSFARRLFRLLGMVANEAKSLFVGATDTGKAKTANPPAGGSPSGK
jgi:hypothetical protein